MPAAVATSSVAAPGQMNNIPGQSQYAITTTSTPAQRHTPKRQRCKDYRRGPTARRQGASTLDGSCCPCSSAMRAELPVGHASTTAACFGALGLNQKPDEASDHDSEPKQHLDDRTHLECCNQGDQNENGSSVEKGARSKSAPCDSTIIASRLSANCHGVANQSATRLAKCILDCETGTAFWAATGSGHEPRDSCSQAGCSAKQVEVAGVHF